MFVFKIREIRKKKNISLYKLNKLTEISLSYLSELENDKKTDPSLAILYKIANCLNVNIKDLFYTKFDINDLKEELCTSIEENGTTHPDTLKISQLIDLIINIDFKEKN